MKLIKTITFIISVSSILSFSIASDNNEKHQVNHSQHKTNIDLLNPYSKEYLEINNKMHEGMTFQSTKNPDKDFVIGMIAHHKGAIEMAKVQIKYGKDPKLIYLANQIIEAQEEEIEFMEEWLLKK